MPTYKITNTVDGDDDPIYVEAPDEAAAIKAFTNEFGPVPRSMLIVAAVDGAPAGEDTLRA